MNTNDTAAVYGNPMMTDEQLDDLRWQHDVSDGWVHTGVEDEAILKVRAFYENLIHEGRLRVVEEVELDASIGGFLMCPSCYRDMRDDEWDGWEFCPCGKKIIKPINP